MGVAVASIDVDLNAVILSVVVVGRSGGPVLAAIFPIGYRR